MFLVEEMEELYKENGLRVIDHFAQDGMSPLLREKIDSFCAAEFEVWCNFHYSICREKSLLGASNHVIIAGRK